MPMQKHVWIWKEEGKKWNVTMKFGDSRKIIQNSIIVSILALLFMFSPAQLNASATTQPTRTAQSRVIYELNRAAAKDLGTYMVLQGACTDGTHGYYMMYSKSKKNCRILKTNLADNQKVKLSGPLLLDHGNDATFNEDTGEIVVANYEPHPRRLTLVDSNTLRVKRIVDVKIPQSLPGATPSRLQSVKGFSGVEYCAERKQYVVRIQKSNNYLLLQEDMKPVRYIKVNKSDSELNQGIDADANYIYGVKSPKKGKFNTVTAYDWKGKYQFQTKVTQQYEMESLFHVGDTFYAGMYHSYYKTYTKTTYKTCYRTYRVKWKKVNGKWKYKTKYRYRKVRYKVKWKKVHGKWKYKTRTKKVRVTYRKAYKKTYYKLMGTNYLRRVEKL